jgi:hypothetical protein
MRLGVIGRLLDGLRPGRHLLPSVPALADHYGPWDRAAGHFRRYGRDDIAPLVDAVGLADLQVVYYRYPAGNVLKQDCHFLAKRPDGLQWPMDDVTADSDLRLETSARSSKVAEAIGRSLGFLQRPFETSE